MKEKLVYEWEASDIKPGLRFFVEGVERMIVAHRDHQSAYNPGTGEGQFRILDLGRGTYGNYLNGGGAAHLLTEWNAEPRRT
jgi:hypothetical protein